LNVLILPFRTGQSEGFEYAIFQRRDGDGATWQAVAGGAEMNESPLDAAKRELEEETGLRPERRWVRLDAHATVPARVFRDRETWGASVYVVHELAFGVEVGRSEAVRLSREHLSVDWLSYLDARERLKWDSNRTALWELNTRLTEA
jgi:dATP pyrophosphohydrolase